MKNENNKKYIRFDWAMKRMLRDKANFAVLEGFLTTLLGHPIKIQKLLESESNQDDADDKQNRVDLLAEDEAGQLYLIEVQNETEVAYFQRMLFGASKLVTEYINCGDNYDRVRKVYSINIVYFNLGGGTDIVYHGKTEFRGIHNGELLPLSPFQKQKFEVDTVSDLYPEYYILKVNDFNRWSKVPLEQWIYFLNTSEIPHDATAPVWERRAIAWRLTRCRPLSGSLTTVISTMSPSSRTTSPQRVEKERWKDVWKVAWKDVRKDAWRAVQRPRRKSHGR